MRSPARSIWRPAKPLMRRIALILPPAGPRRWATFSVRARFRASRTTGSDAERWSLLRPTLGTTAAFPDAWKSAFESAANSGHLHEAFERAGSTITNGASPGLITTYWRATRQLGTADDIATATDQITSSAPKTQRQLDRVTQVLRKGTPEVANLYLQRLVQQGERTLDLTELTSVVDELTLADADSVEDFDEALAEIRNQGRIPILAVLSALRSRSEWTRFANFLRSHAEPHDTTGRMEWILRAALKRAWQDGAVTATLEIISFIESAGLSDDESRSIKAEAADFKKLLNSTWELPDRRRPRVVGAHQRVISVLGQSLPLRSGGYATRSHGVLTALAARGWDMSAVTRLGFPYDLWRSTDDERPVAASDIVDGIRYDRLLPDGAAEYRRHPLHSYVDRFADELMALAEPQQPALLHASSLYDVGLAGLTAARRMGVPFVYEMRGLKQLLEAARVPAFAGSEKEMVLDELEATVARESDQVLVITDALGKEMARHGVDPERIRVVPNGVHVDRFTPRPRDPGLESQLGLARRTVIGYVGGLVHYEGLELLLEAVADLPDRSAFHVLIVGDGAHERATRNCAERLGLGPDILTFTGRVPHHDVERYLSLIDITPFPRLPLRVCELISPIKPFESMAMAKAVVASDVAALQEIITDGTTGRLFRKGDANDLRRVLGELIASPEDRQKLGENARSWVRANRDWNVIAGSVELAYQRVLG